MIEPMDAFSPELIGIFAIGATLAALVLRQGARLDRRIDLLTEHMNERFQRVDERFQRVDERFQRVEERFQGIDGQLQKVTEQIRDLGERVARLEGKIDLIEGFIARRNEPPGAPAE